MVSGFNTGMLFEASPSNAVKFTGLSTVITAAWVINHYADSLAIIGSNWTSGVLTVNSQGVNVINNMPIQRRGDNTVIKFGGMFMISSMTLTLNSVPDNLYVGVLWIGRRLELPRFRTGMKYNRNVLSQTGKTKYGIAYGIKKPTIRGFDVTIEDIDNAKKLMLENYIDYVQYVTPHLIEPYEAPEFEPIYGTLTSGGSFDKRDDTGFRWNTALSYEESK
jgi:hypothetical protein